MKTRSDRPRIPVVTTLVLSLLALTLIAPWGVWAGPALVAPPPRRAR